MSILKAWTNLISRPVIFLDRGFGMTPMDQGLRAVGTVELGGLNNPPSKKRIDYVIRCAKELLPQLEKHQDEWLGFRPTLPRFFTYSWPVIKKPEYYICIWSSSFRVDFGGNNRQNYLRNSCRREKQI